MKKIFSMLLVAAMLVAMLPCFAVGVSAEDATEAVVIGTEATNPADPWAPAWAGGTGGIIKQILTGSTTAALDSPAVIERLDIVSGGRPGRANGCKISGSWDGENWEELAEIKDLPGSVNYATRYSIPINSEKTYRYIRIEGNGGDWCCHSSFRQLEVYGYERSTDDVDVAFTQTKIDDTAWSVRFVSTVDKAAVDANTYSMIGYNITATGTGITDKSWTNLESNTVYTGVYEVQAGSDAPVLTAAPDGSYFHMVTFKDISLTDYEDVTFTITPYAVLSDGETYVYGTPKTIAFVDGVRADA